MFMKKPLLNIVCRQRGCTIPAASEVPTLCPVCNNPIIVEDCDEFLIEEAGGSANDQVSHAKTIEDSDFDHGAPTHDE